MVQGGALMYILAVLTEYHLHHSIISPSLTPTNPKVAAPDLLQACQPKPSHLVPRTPPMW